MMLTRRNLLGSLLAAPLACLWPKAKAKKQFTKVWHVETADEPIEGYTQYTFPRTCDAVMALNSRRLPRFGESYRGNRSWIAVRRDTSRNKRTGMMEVTVTWERTGHA